MFVASFLTLTDLVTKACGSVVLDSEQPITKTPIAIKELETH